MKYFCHCAQQDNAIQYWYSAQFDLCDIVLSLTDNHIQIGAKIYAIFCRPEVLNLMKYFICDFIKIKNDLGIVGSYVERAGNIYSKSFNPLRNNNVLTLSKFEMRNKSKQIYMSIIADLGEITRYGLKKLQHNNVLKNL